MRINFLSSIFVLSIFSSQMFSQTSSNCFLQDFRTRKAVIPPSINAVQPTAEPTVKITIAAADTIGKVSKYIFGNALAVWVGNDVNNPTLLKHLKNLSPSLIRYPGGSWSDIFFWNKSVTDIPDSLCDGTKNGQKYKFYPQFGTGSWPTTLDNYYSIRSSLQTEGLITINYAYARYGLSANPVAQAAHLAAEWVRYDDGRTRFWEIGNENGGPWEAGWQIDTKQNKDGQPAIITGELYGKHVKIIIDSMKAAAKKLDNTIFIGGQVLHYDGTTSWNSVDRKWNDGFFKEAGNSVDFYVMHNYFGTSTDAKSLLDIATSETQKNIDFIRQDVASKNAPNKPVAITEYNMQGTTGYELAKTSVINGMQATILFCEMIKNNFGMSSRWLIANNEDGMFYLGSNTNIPKWNPRPDFYYAYYLQKYFGDRSIKAISDNNNVLVYASTFSSGETGVVVVNKGLTAQIVKLLPSRRGVGDKFYVYSLTGGTDNGEFSQNVYVNGTGPTGQAWGPLDGLETLPATAYPIDTELKLNSPARSVQFILIDKGSKIVSVKDEKAETIHSSFTLDQNYPNPFNPSTVISYSVSTASHVILKVFDVLGREVATLVNEIKSPGAYTAQFSILNSQLATGIYFYSLKAGEFFQTRKMILIK